MTAAKEEYLQIVAKIQSTRYFNIRRSGTIICRHCRHKSTTPIAHVEHVTEKHRFLRCYCPYCQRVIVSTEDGRVSKQATLHLKFCCFVYKVENARYRKILNTMSPQGISRETIQCEAMLEEECENSLAHATILTEQLQDGNYYVNVVEYELSTTTTTCNSDSVLPIPQNSESSFMQRVQTLQSFFDVFTLNDDNRYPAWLQTEEYDCGKLETIVERNRLRFHPSENIDCRLIRLISLQGFRFDIYKYTIKYNVLVQHIARFQNAVQLNQLAITRYIRVHTEAPKDSGPGSDYDNETFVHMIIIGATMVCRRHIETLSEIAECCTEIRGLDKLVDECYNLSSSSTEFVFPPPSKHHLIGLVYANDVLAVAPDPYPILSSRTPVPDAAGYTNYFYSPLSMYAKIYFYSQSKQGCVRAFERLISNDNLIDYIDEVYEMFGKFYLNYGSFRPEPDAPCFAINLREDECFASEAYLRANHRDTSTTVAENASVFILDPRNMMLVTPKDDDKDRRVFFPNCLFGTNICHTLNAQQVSIYTVTQFYREKLLLEMNNIPNVTTFSD